VPAGFFREPKENPEADALGSQAVEFQLYDDPLAVDAKVDEIQQALLAQAERSGWPTESFETNTHIDPAPKKSEKTSVRHRQYEAKQQAYGGRHR
jgi:hypothetical protein